MKANDLIIGDWVHNNLTNKNEQIAHSDNVADMLDNFSPIPITKEILDDNEIDHTEDAEFYSLGINDMEIYFADGITVMIRTAKANMEVQVEYVHELQHCLWLAGLNKSISNL